MNVLEFILAVLCLGAAVKIVEIITLANTFKKLPVNEQKELIKSGSSLVDKKKTKKKVTKDE